MTDKQNQSQDAPAKPAPKRRWTRTNSLPASSYQASSGKPLPLTSLATITMPASDQLAKAFP